MSAPDPWAVQRSYVESQYAYLLKPRRTGLNVCSVCRGPATNPPYERCFQCNQHFKAARGMLADVVAPISYSVKQGDNRQHHHNLILYKGQQPSQVVQLRLMSLLTVFLVDHARCLVRAAKALSIGAAAVVPSTRGRPGRHPLQELIGDQRLGVPWVSLSTNTAVPPTTREFRSDWFSVDTPIPASSPSSAVLLLDDTWTTGSRVQSAAHTLKRAGADRVIVVTLARHARPESYAPWRPLIAAAESGQYDPEVCVFCPQEL